jgi:hypothetical protein
MHLHRRVDVGINFGTTDYENLYVYVHYVRNFWGVQN